MEKKEFTYRLIGLILSLLMSMSSLSAAQYHGDQPSSPFVRFLRSLFFGGSSSGQKSASQTSGQTYHLSPLSQGSSTGANSASQSDAPAGSSSDIWAVTPNTSSSHAPTATSTVEPSAAASSTSSSYQVGSVSSGSAANNSQAGGGATTGSSVGSATSSDLIAFSLSTPFSSSMRQNAPAATEDGGDGFDDPSDPVADLPVGDGTWTLLFLAVVYALSTRKRLTQRPDTSIS
jgi:hypothetical protein